MTLIGWSVCWNDSVVARLGLLCGRNDWEQQNGSCECELSSRNGFVLIVNPCMDNSFLLILVS